MLNVSAGEYTVSCSVGELPITYSILVAQARFHDDFGVRNSRGTALLVSVERASKKVPELVVTQRFEPGPESGFFPGVLIVPETHLLMIGAGTRLLAYDINSVRRLWEDYADTGFWFWKRHGQTILMSAELELAAWNLGGKKLWSAFTEPPWSYEVHGHEVELDIMGSRACFDLTRGPVFQGE